MQAFCLRQIGLSCRRRSTFEETVLHETSVFRFVLRFLCFWEGDFGCFLRDFNGVVKFLAWNRNGK